MESPLDIIGELLKELCLSGNISELEKYVVSERLTLEEAGLLAGQSQLLNHLNVYANNHMAISTNGICILQADINGDGIKDIVEYGPGEGYWFVNTMEEEINTLLIFLGEEDNSYSLHYSQPFFKTQVRWGELIQVINYKNEQYLLFNDGNNRLSAYWLNNGIPDGKVSLQFKPVSWKAEILEEKKGYGAEILLEDNHIREPYLLDSISTEIEMDDDEEKVKLIEKFNAAFKAELHTFDDSLEYYPLVDIVYESDINNDGINEQYVKTEGRLALFPEELFDIGITGGPALVTGRYYGQHEGRNGLIYYMESAGKKTDFKQLFGLDIWGGELTPLWFCVRNTEKGNVIYLIYQDENEFEKRIDGYFAKGKQYEKVLSVRYLPEIQCNLLYEDNDTEENKDLNYFTCLAEDGRSVEFVFGNNNALEATINLNIQEIIDEKISDLEEEGMKHFTINRNTLTATEESYVMEYMIVFEKPLEQDKNYAEEYERRRYRMEVDVTTGKCKDFEIRENI